MHENGAAELLDTIVIETEKPAENGQGETTKIKEAYIASGQHTFSGPIFVNTDANIATVPDKWTITHSSHPCTEEPLSHRSVVLFPPGATLTLERGNEKVVIERNETPWITNQE